MYNYASNSWRKIESDIKPPVRANSYMAYDESRDIMVIFGGSHFNHVVYSDTWTLDMGSETWSEITTEPSSQSQEEPQSIPGFDIYIIALSLIVFILVYRLEK